MGDIEDKEKAKSIVLTGKQKKFADYYVGEANLNATRAAKMAGYSPASAYSIGFENLRKPEISAYIENRLDEISMSSKEVLAGLTFEAKGSIADILEEDGTLNYQSMCKRGADKLIKKIKIIKTTRREKGSEDEIEEIKHEVEMYDAQAAKVHIGKARGLFVDKHEITGANGKDLMPGNITINVNKLDKIWGDDEAADEVNDAE